MANPTFVPLVVIVEGGLQLMDAAGQVTVLDYPQGSAVCAPDQGAADGLVQAGYCAPMTPPSEELQ